MTELLVPRCKLSYKMKLISQFCTVHTSGFFSLWSSIENKWIDLNFLFRKYEFPKKSPPSFFQVTNHSKERPDVWVESPEKLVILLL